MKRERRGWKAVDWTAYQLSRLAAAGLQALPERAAIALGKGIGRLIYWTSGKRFERMEAQVRLVYGESLSPAEHRRIARESFLHLGLSAVETLRMPLLTSENWPETFPQEDMNRLFETLGEGGSVIVTAHLGAYHFAAHVAALGRPGAGLAAMERPFDNPYIAKFVSSLRGGAGEKMSMINKFDSFLEVRKAINQGRAVCLVYDQDGGKRGVFADFLGYPASTWTSAAETHLLLKVPIVVGSTHRVGYGPQNRLVTHGRIDWKPLPEASSKEEKRRLRDERVLEIVEQINAWLGDAIRDHPEQWMWAHRRWKTRPKGDPVPVINGVPRPWLMDPNAPPPPPSDAPEPEEEKSEEEALARNTY
jgi:KDO2-lipid IV(A) lauroyltransferase